MIYDQCADMPTCLHLMHVEATCGQGTYAPEKFHESSNFWCAMSFLRIIAKCYQVSPKSHRVNQFLINQIKLNLISCTVAASFAIAFHKDCSYFIHRQSCFYLSKRISTSRILMQFNFQATHVTCTLQKFCPH